MSLETRDQQAIGEAILNRDRKRHPKASAFADSDLYGIALPEFPKDESTCSLTQREYRARLIRKAHTGDDHALRRLEEIDPVIAGVVSNRIEAGGIFHPDRDLHVAAQETLTRTMVDALEHASWDDPDPGDADKPAPGCVEWNGPLDLSCVKEYGHDGLHEGKDNRGRTYRWVGK